MFGKPSPLIPINVSDARGGDIILPSILCVLNVVGQVKQIFEVNG